MLYPVSSPMVTLDEEGIDQDEIQQMRERGFSEEVVANRIEEMREAAGERPSEVYVDDDIYEDIARALNVVRRVRFELVSAGMAGAINTGFSRAEMVAVMDALGIAQEHRAETLDDVIYCESVLLKDRQK